MKRALSDIQRSFAAAAVDSRMALPPDIGGGQHEGFAVHRNNIAVGLIEALRDRFPVTERLVGEPFFRAMARGHVVLRKPASPLLMEYGDDFPEYIDGYAPAAAVPYLADMARLEAAWSRAYSAAEATPLDCAALRACDPEQFLRVRLRLHPSVQTLRSPFPVASIWSSHQGPGEPTAPDHWEAEDVLVLRPDAQVTVHRMAPGGHAFLERLADDAMVEAAAEAALAHAADFDLGGHVLALFAAGAVTHIRTQHRH